MISLQEVCFTLFWVTGKLSGFSRLELVHRHQAEAGGQELWLKVTKSKELSRYKRELGRTQNQNGQASDAPLCSWTKHAGENYSHDDQWGNPP